MTKKKSLKQWLKKLETSHNKKIDLGLVRVKQVYNNLILNKIAPTIITVAGTNGKGSTVAILSAICQQAGYKVGEFTSPHIFEYNERIKVNSTNGTDKSIIQAFEKIQENLNGVSLSYFEYATLAASIIFKQQKVDIAILEVGLGGRLDSVNAIDTDCAIITTIDIDHTSWLGNNREAIGFEKAGIMRRNTLAIYGGNNCPNSIIKHAKDIQAHLIFANKQNIEIPALNIQGQYQHSNAKTAIIALAQLPKLTIDKVAITKGLQNIKLYGRLQTLSENPQVLIDVSHNHQAVTELVKWLKFNPVKGRTIAVFAVLADKDPITWLELFADIIDMWCITEVNSDRAMPSNVLVQVLADSAPLITSYKNSKLALKAAKMVSNSDDRIVVFGSFYTVSEALVS